MYTERGGEREGERGMGCTSRTFLLCEGCENFLFYPSAECRVSFSMRSSSSLYESRGATCPHVPHCVEVIETTTTLIVGRRKGGDMRRLEMMENDRAVGGVFGDGNRVCCTSLDIALDIVVSRWVDSYPRSWNESG